METLNPRPKGIRTEEYGGALVVTRTWYSPGIWFVLLFCLIWNGFFVVWYVVALKQPSPGDIAFWFPLLHASIGLFWAYSVLTGFFNTTEIRVGDGKLVVRHGPLPWVGNKTIDVSVIGQLFCDEVIHRGRRSVSSRYRLNAVLSDGQKEVLVAAGINRDQALYLEHLIENRIGIKPALVVGELAR